jgi:hypothetical protein
MEVKLNLPPKAVRMIQALNALRGNRGAADIEDHLSKLVIKELKREIAEECGLHSGAYSSTAPVIEKMPGEDPRKEPIQAQEKMPQTFEDTTQIAEGLGDDFDYESQEDEGMSPGGNLNMPNRKGAVKAQDLDNDMDLEDPEKEAKVEAPTMPNQAEAEEHAEETFQQMVLGEDAGDDDPWAQRRKYKNPDAKRAKVQGFSGDNVVSPEGGLTI